MLSGSSSSLEQDGITHSIVANSNIMENTFFMIFTEGNFSPRAAKLHRKGSAYLNISKIIANFVATNNIIR